MQTEAAEQGERAQARKRDEVVSLARRGLPGKAVQHAASLGLAPDTPEVEAIMRAKFVQAPPRQRESARLPAPPANELTEADVAAAIISFKRGVEPGPAGQRPDLDRQIIGEKGDRPGCAILAGICNLLADGRGPPQLRPYLGGARATALAKKTKDGRDDARPACAGEAIRRVVGKALLATEVDVLTAHLLAHQLAVGTRAGVEAMPHLARQWLATHSQDTNRVLINTDEANAHNEVDRHTFLTRMREITPGLARWLEYVYPTDVPTKVFYRGKVIDSEAGGQQGCPLIGACHAVTKRLLYESLGLVPPLVGSAVHLPILDPPVALDMAPAFADDCLLAGPAEQVGRALEHLTQVMPRFLFFPPRAPLSHRFV